MSSLFSYDDFPLKDKFVTIKENFKDIYENIQNKKE